MSDTTQPVPAGATRPAAIMDAVSMPVAGGAADPTRTWRRRRVWFLRFVSLCLLAAGLWSWAIMLGFTDYAGTPFLSLPFPVRNGLAAFAVADLVTAVGLWLGVTWGSVLLVVDALLRITLHTVWGNLHGNRPVATIGWIVMLVALAALLVLGHREMRMADELRRRQRKANRAVRTAG